VRALASLALGLVLAVPAACADAASLDGSWRGTFTLPRPIAFSVQIRGNTATVTLPAGHAAPAVVPLRKSGARVRFAVAGRPTPLAFDGRLRKGVLSGTVTQSGLRGSFTLRRGKALDSGDLGVYALDNGHAVSVQVAGGRRLLVDYDASEIHGLFPRADGTWEAGSGLGVRDPVSGAVRFEQHRLELSLHGETHHGARLDRHEEEVRFRSGGVTLAGTLTLPVAQGKHAAVVLVHGSGATPRNDGAVFAAYFASRGFAVLTYDKRGIEQSGGKWPGEAATTQSVDVYARDAEAAARFLAAQPEIDATRLGLTGASQAGWIMPLAASREPAVRFLVIVSGPAVTTGEQQTYQGLTTEGASTPAQTPAEILAEVRRVGPTGFDPLPSIRQLAIPALWLLGQIDQHVPTSLSVERLGPVAQEPGHDFRYLVFPGADHFLLESEHALIAEDLRSSRYASGLFLRLGEWLQEHRLL
jgi:dipeptidyl aminopeptidase/acylaminoacyl peptidase